MRIDMIHGNGGKQTSSLINDIFIKYFSNKVLNRLEDAAIVSVKGKIAFTTDSFVVSPIFFPGGDIGKLAVCGTVNDLSVMGATPKYLTVGFIIEEGIELDTIDKIANSMAMAAKEARVKIVAGDTKVIEGTGGIYINTSGIGEVEKAGISISYCKPGDVILLSGNLGDHQATILSQRMNMDNKIISDCAPLTSIVQNLIKESITIRCMRDITRGGLATVLNELASASKCGVDIEEDELPVSKEVRDLCTELELDPLYMANEGKMIAVVSKRQAMKALDIMKNSRYGKNAKIIGTITEGSGVMITSKQKGSRILEYMHDEGLPRIC